MPPKNGKKKGKGGKKGKGKGKKAKADQLTPNELILEYKINLQENTLQELNFQLSRITEEREKGTEKLRVLRDERNAYETKMRENIRKYNQDQINRDSVEKEHVIEAMKENWDVKKSEIESLRAINEEITDVERQISQVKREISYWKMYEIGEKNTLATQVKILRKLQKDAHENFNLVKKDMENKYLKRKDGIQTNLQKQIKEQETQANSKAMKHLDKNTICETDDNKWLKSELKTHEDLLKSLQQSVKELEMKNLKIISKFYQNSVEELKVPKSAFLTQVHEQDNIAQQNVMELDLLDIFKNNDNDDFLEEERPETQLEMMSELLIGDEWAEYLSPGPINVKLMHVSGHAMPIYESQPRTAEEEKMQEWNPDEWPVKKIMISDLMSTETNEVTP